MPQHPALAGEMTPEPGNVNFGACFFLSFCHSPSRNNWSTAVITIDWVSRVVYVVGVLHGDAAALQIKRVADDDLKLVDFKLPREFYARLKSKLSNGFSTF